MENFENYLIFSKDIYDSEINKHKNISEIRHKNIVLYSVLLTSLANNVLNEPYNSEFFIYRSTFKKMCKLVFPDKDNLSLKNMVHCLINKAIKDNFIEKKSNYVFSHKKGIIKYPKFLVKEKLIQLANNIKSTEIYTINPNDIKALNSQITYMVEFDNKQYFATFGGAKELTRKIYDEYKEHLKTIYSTAELLKYYNDLSKHIKESMVSYDTIQSNLRNIIEMSFSDYSSLYKNTIYNKKSVKEHTAYINVNELIDIINELSFSNIESDIKIRNILIHVKNNLVQNTLTMNYFRSDHGRFYAIGPSLQFVSKKYRDRILSDYTAIDINAATFSILYNYAVKLGYDKSKLLTIYEYKTNSKKFRDNIYKELKISDKLLDPEYVKQVLNALAFGANLNETLVLQDIQRGTRKTIPTQIDGWYNSETPLNIVVNEKVIALKSELSELMTFLNNEHKVRDNNQLYLINSSLQKMVVNNRVSRGKKLAHIYQSAESEILLTIINSIYKKKKLLDNFGAIGLLLHDGVYIKTDIFEKLGGLTYFENLILDNLGYSLSIAKE